MIENNKKNVGDKVIQKIAPTVLATAGLLLIVLVFITVSDSRGTSAENNAYIRVINCIVSYNASARTQENIEGCYVTVERDLNTKLQRYDRSTQ